MGLSASDYLNQQFALLPRGAAWPRDPNSVLGMLLDGKAQEYARIDNRAEDLGIEANPLSTLELLPDWERVCGLPDPCVGQVEPTVQGRRNAIVSKLAAPGGASVAYFTAVALALGYFITITQYRPFTAGSGVAGGALTGGDWIYTWTVNLPTTTEIAFRAGIGCAGEPLESWGDAMFQCRFNHLKPAHTILLFAYDIALDPDALLDEDGDEFTVESGDILEVES